MEPLQSGDPERVGPYRLLGRLGAGGMGQVFLARSPGGRPVVVKAIRSEYASDTEYRTRFTREVEAARRVGGFHTAQVVAADPAADPPWMATAYVPGPSLQRAVTERGPLTERNLSTLAAGLVEGLAAIHSCGLVHRDFKPSNIILAADGPRVIDFGIARPLDASAMTQSGEVVGTLAYMSPEQIEGRPAGPASDVFSLGTVLAFAATGRSPFVADSIGAIVLRIVGAPPDLTGLPADLKRLIRACWEQDPDRRPTTAELLAQLSTDQTGDDWPPSHLADLIGSVLSPGPADSPTPPSAAVEPPRSHGPSVPPGRRPEPGSGATGIPKGSDPVVPQSGRPSPGARPSPWERLSPARKSLVGGAVTVAVVGLAVSLLIWFSLFFLTASEVEDLSEGTGESPEEVADPPDPRILGIGGEVLSVVFSPDGSTVASGGGDGAVRLWDAASGEERAILAGHTDWVRSVTFSPDGSTVASGGDDSAVRLWDAASGEERAVLAGHTNFVLFVFSVAFSPDGTMLASGNSDGTVRLWDAASGEERAVLEGHANFVLSVVFSPDGSVLASGGGDGTARLWPLDGR